MCRPWKGLRGELRAPFYPGEALVPGKGAIVQITGPQGGLSSPCSLYKAATPPRRGTCGHPPSVLCRARPTRVFSRPGSPGPSLVERGGEESFPHPPRRSGLSRLSSPSSLLAASGPFFIMIISRQSPTWAGDLQLSGLFRALVLCPRTRLWGHPRHHPKMIGLKLCT